MQDGQRWEGRGGLLEGGEEGHKMCCECVSTLFVSCDFALKAAVVMGANGGYNRANKFKEAHWII